MFQIILEMKEMFKLIHMTVSPHFVSRELFHFVGIDTLGALRVEKMSVRSSQLF